MSTNAALGRHAARHGLEPGRLEQALEWQVTLWSGELDDAGHREWAAWLAAHPGNQHAWAEVERLAGRLGELPSDVARHTLKRPRRFSRRQALTLFGLAGAGALLARGGWVERAVADCRSGPGEQRDLALPDGSSLKLNTASAVNLAFDGERRLRVLPGSEIALDSRGAGGGPLRVEMAEMRLDVADSQVVLRDYGERLAVSVLAGRVNVLSGPGVLRAGAADAATGTATLRGGEAAWLSAAGVHRFPLDRGAALDWTRGVLRADRLPLGTFLAELGRYRHGLLYCDDEVAGLVVSGAFQVPDTDYALQSLAQALPVAVHYRTPWLVRVSVV